MIEKLTRSLTVRITLIILLAGPIIYLGLSILFLVLSVAIFKGQRNAPAIALSFFVSIFLTGLILGGVSRRLLLRPLRILNQGIEELKTNQLNDKLVLTGIDDFDQAIIELNKLKAQLRNEEQLRNNLISDTSHELKTPVAALLIQLQGMEDKVIDLDEKHVVLLKNQVERLRFLIEGLQQYSSIRAKTIQLQKEDIVLQRCLLDLKEMYRLSFKEKGLAFEISVPDNFVVCADPKLLQQVFTNLIENSMKYSEGTLLEIEAFNNTITIKDNGKGIPKDKLSYIFERFYRVDESRNKELGGLGLGLSIVKEIVEAHGWKINAESKEGLRFLIRI